MNCRSCGHEMDENERFCSECGADNAAPQDLSAAGGEITAKNFSNRNKVIFISAVAALLLTGGLVTAIAVNNGSHSAESIMALAERYLNEQNYEKAVIEFLRVIEIEPMNVDAYLGLAEAYLAMGDTENAVRVLQTGLEITGDYRISDRLDFIFQQNKEPLVFHNTHSIAASGGSCYAAAAITNDNNILYVKYSDEEAGKIYCEEKECWENKEIVSVVCENDPSSFLWLYSDGTVGGDGNMMGFLNGSEGYENGEYTDITDIAIGVNTSFLLRSDGTVLATQEHYSREVYSSFHTWQDITELTSSVGGTLFGLKSDGTVVVDGHWTDSFSEEISKWTDIVSVYSWFSLAFGVHSDGTVSVAGGDDIESTEATKRIAKIKAELSGWTDIRQIVGYTEELWGLRRDGTVIGVCDRDWMPNDWSTWSDIVEISFNAWDDGSWLVGLRSDGTLLICGYEQLPNQPISDMLYSVDNIKLPQRQYAEN